MPGLRLRKLLPFVAAGIVVGLGAAGCLLTTDLDGLAGPAVGGEAGADTSVPDGSRDAAGDDGAADAGPDGAIVTDAAYDGSVSPCTAPHAFCSDFDTGDLPGPWDTLTETGGGSTTFDGNALSQPRSFRVIHTRKTEAGQIFRAVSKVVATSWRRVLFQGDLYFEQPAWQAGDVNICFVALFYNSSSGNSGTLLFQSEGAAAGTIEALAQDAPGHDMPISMIPYNRWTHVLIDFDPNGSVAYEIDGQRASRTFTPKSGGGGQNVIVQVGSLNYNNPVPSVDIRWDNVTVDLP